MGLHIQTYARPDAFVRRAEPWLLEAEAENNLLLGLGRKLQESVADFEPPIFLATIEDDGAVVGCAFRTPPFKLGITRMPEEALPLLVDEVERVYGDIPAVLGPEPQAQAFAVLWSERRGVAARAPGYGRASAPGVGSVSSTRTWRILRPTRSTSGSGTSACAM